MPAVRLGRQNNHNTVTSLSKRVQSTTSKRAPSGRVLPIRASLNAAKILQAKEEDARKAAEHLQNMSQEERRDRDILRGDFFALDGGDDSWEDDVLHGRAAADISHAGEAMPEDPERADGDLFQGLRQNQRRLWGHRRYPDLRTRRNRTQLQVDGFAKQIERMADAYLELGGSR
ncbi:hypothetical protein B0H14DRAFT_3142310 [Mycena olivaceomarginata]|nr:hypothetical protein B0H14DRAFT_3142310 [Mycena olivaceomarginata]